MINNKRNTIGSNDLTGCLGIPLAKSFNLKDIIKTGNDKTLFKNIDKRSLEIITHYGTEPLRMNFVPVTTFFNPIC